MGRHTEQFRELISHIPNHTKGLTPAIARECILQISNGALQVIAGLEETLEDKDKEIDRLTEALIGDGSKAKGWHP